MLIVFFSAFFIWRIMRYPIEVYYHWDDPLDFNPTDGDIYEERMKYKTKISDWKE
jgi:hypothetical protein